MKYLSSGVRVVCLGLGALVGVLPGVGAAATAKAAKVPVLALLPLATRDNPDPAVVEAFATLLGKAAASVPEINLIAADDLTTQLKMPSGSKVGGRCAGRAPCYAAIGKKVGAQEVVTIDALGMGLTARITVSVIDVATKTKSRTVVFDLRGVDEVKAALATKLYDVLGVTDPGLLTVEGFSGQVLVDGAVVGEGQGPFSLKPGRHEVALGHERLAVMILPGKTKTVAPSAVAPQPSDTAEEAESASEGVSFEASTDNSAEATPAAVITAVAVADGGTPRAGAAPAAPSPPPVLFSQPVSTTAELPPVKPRFMMPAGIGLTATGLVAAAVGIGFRVQATSIEDSFGRQDSQLAAARRLQDARRAADRANVLFAVGISTAVLGGALMVVDLLSN
jgi:hypothetical protein